MKTFRFFLPAVAVLPGTLTATPAFGASKKKPSPTPSKVPTIATATADSITVAEENTTKTLIITQFTEIYLNGTTDDGCRSETGHDGQHHVGHRSVEGQPDQRDRKVIETTPRGVQRLGPAETEETAPVASSLLSVVYIDQNCSV